jgi:hypothetical protein
MKTKTQPDTQKLCFAIEYKTAEAIRQIARRRGVYDKRNVTIAEVINDALKQYAGAKHDK